MTMEAGRELDALIAEKVMDLVPCEAWEYINFGSAGGPALVNANCIHGQGRRCYPTTEIGGGVSLQGIGGPPHYSTDIAAAWEIVEKFGHYKVNTFPGEIPGQPPTIRVELTRFHPEAFGYADADTVPLAICRAALKALGVRQPDDRMDLGFGPGVILVPGA